MRVLLVALFSLASALVVYALWLDGRVRSAFEGKRWALPARVYARPLEIYAGATISVGDLRRELEELGYRQASAPRRSGEFSQNGGLFHLHTRRFTFWDGIDPERRMQIVIRDGQVASLRDAVSREPIPVVRLEPSVIAKIYPEHNEDRILIRYEDAPPALIQALIAVEDRHFFSHFGLDPVAIARAALANLLAGEIREGGSTLTQQLVKNFYLDDERTWWRKFNEAIMAVLLESHYSKTEILEAYLNEIYLGQNGPRAIHGFGLAAEFYFRRPLNELSIDQLALLVGLARGASYYNPRRYPERALKRRNLVLRLMQEQGYLDALAAQRYMAASLNVSKEPGWVAARFPAFVDLVRRQLRNDYAAEDLRSQGLKIFTTLDVRYQRAAAAALARRLPELEQARAEAKPLEGAIIVSAVDTGEVLALAGGRRERPGAYNRALDAARPIGSLIKPAVYLSALALPERFSVITPLEDAPVRLPQRNGEYWEPDNYDRRSHGTVPLYEALAQSYNLATVRVGLDVGLGTVARTLRDMGVTRHIPEYPSLLLGAIDLTPLAVAQMYQTLAGGGFQTPLKTIVAVLDNADRPLRRYPVQVRQTLRSDAVYLATFLLTQVVERGTARAIAAAIPESLPIAGKTGTTNDLRDSWFAGFGSDVLTVVWVGRDDNQSAGLSGAAGALQVWLDVMRKLPPTPLKLAPPPDGIVWISVREGKRTDENCPNASQLPFMETHLPAEYLPCTYPATTPGLPGIFRYRR